MPRPKKSLEDHVRDRTYREDRHGPLPPNLLRIWNGGNDVAIADVPNNEACKTESIISIPVGIEKPGDIGDEAGLIWDWLIEKLAGTITDRDAMRLRDLAEWWAELNRARRSMAELKPGTIGYTRVMNAVAVCEDRVNKASERFGLTPADRAKLRVSNPISTSPKVPTIKKPNLPPPKHG
jgi:hypothetical protein